MAQGDIQIIVVDNLTADLELKYTQNGTAAANFRVASTPRVYRDDQWVDGEGMLLTYSLWREVVESAVESLSKGTRVIVQGRLRQCSYETRESERRTVFEVEIDEMGPSLKLARAQVTHIPRNSGENFGDGNRDQGGNAGGGFGGDFGGNQGNQGGQSNRDLSGGVPAEDPWSSAPLADGGFGGDELPF